MANKPSITAWNRLEPRPRSKDFTRSLRAEVRDPLWMLTRQMHMGEFKAQDRVTPAYAKVSYEHTIVSGYFPDTVGVGAPLNYKGEIPMEAMVERSFILRDLGLAAQLGRHWAKLLKRSGLAGYTASFLSYHPIPQFAAGTSPFQDEAEETRMFRTSVAGKIIDGVSLLNAIKQNKNHPLVVTGPVDQVTQGKLVELGDQFDEWFKRLYSEPTSEDEKSWSDSRLEHKFKVKTESNEELSSDGLQNGKLDWYSYNKLQGNGSRTLTEETFIPTPIQFPGMPLPRWWEMEDYNVSFSDLRASPADLNKLLYLEFMYVYKNDWFVLPLTLQEGSLSRIKGLIVTDIFGLKYKINDANELTSANDTDKWTMYSLSTKKGDIEFGAVRNLFLPPITTNALESKPLEQVSFVRDEMANMVWGVEKVVPDGLGRGISGHEEALRRKAILGSTTQSEEDDALTFKLATSVPYNWIPFIPVHVPNSLRSVQLQRGQMAPVDALNPAENLVRPTTQLLSDPVSPYYIHEEEVTRAGTIVSRTFQRARWYDGKTVLWSGYKKQLGRGEANSGLLFDQIKTKEV
mgnify:CR=1 FL=1